MAGRDHTFSRGCSWDWCKSDEFMEIGGDRLGMKLDASLHWLQIGHLLTCWNCLQFSSPFTPSLVGRGDLCPYPSADWTPPIHRTFYSWWRSEFWCLPYVAIVLNAFDLQGHGPKVQAPYLFCRPTKFIIKIWKQRPIVLVCCTVGLPYLEVIELQVNYLNWIRRAANDVIVIMLWIHTLACDVASL